MVKKAVRKVTKPSLVSPNARKALDEDPPEDIRGRLAELRARAAATTTSTQVAEASAEEPKEEPKKKGKQGKKGKTKIKVPVSFGLESDVERDSFMKSLAGNLRKKTGASDIYLGSETGNLVIGIPMFGGREPDHVKYPGCLPFEFVIGQDCFPLSLVVQLVAKPGVGKSAFGAEIARWFQSAKGFFSLFEHETKFNPKHYRAILGEQGFDDYTLYHRCEYIEQWQSELTNSINGYKELFEGSAESPGVGPTVPVLFCVDSIMGKGSKETSEKIFGAKTKKGIRGKTGEGHATRNFPIEAQIITKYLRAMPSELDRWPFSVLLINHLKTRLENGVTTRDKPGGEGVSFQESWEIQLEKKSAIETLDFDGNVVGISCHKNSFAPGTRKATTRILWNETDIEDGKGWRQNTWVDWDWATINLLNDLLKGDKAVRIKKNLIDLDLGLSCQQTGHVTNTCTFRKLGITKPVSWAEAGYALRRDQKLLKEIRNALRINTLPILKGSYVEQLNKLAEEAP